jgi:hypothetical protein
MSTDAAAASSPTGAAQAGPAASVPLELLAEVLGYLPPLEVARTAARVCKAWREVTEGQLLAWAPSIFADLDPLAILGPRRVARALTGAGGVRPGQLVRALGRNVCGGPDCGVAGARPARRRSR